MTTDPAIPAASPAEPGPPAPGIAAGLPGGQAGFPGCACSGEEEVDVLYLAGQRPGSHGAWLLVTSADGDPGGEFLARILPAGGRHAHGGDVLVHLAADTTAGGAVSVCAGVWAVLGGLLVPVAAWDRQDPDWWPEQVRAAAAFAMGVITELGEHGADLGTRHGVRLDAAVATARGGIPLGLTLSPAGPGGRPGG